MSVVIKEVEKRSAAHKAKLQAGDVLLSINGNEIMDVLDYRFWQNDTKLTLEYIDGKGKQKSVKIKKDEFEEIGLIFDTYLMDKQRHCQNKCIFCFIDQLPKGLRESLYFKDDDSRLSFLFGNYITLTNITEHEIERIINMHISPINISVHTTNPDLRVEMMKNPNAGKALDIITRFNNAGIKLNCQLVLVPDYNDKKELERSLRDLLSLENVECVAAVPVGLTRYREGLAQIKPFDKKGAEETIKIIDFFGDMCLEKYGDRRVFAADEFYILAEKELPKAEYYEEFHQLENGVGLVPLFLEEAENALGDFEDFNLDQKRNLTVVTGEAAQVYIKQTVDKCLEKWENLECNVVAIKNNFFGGEITVTGLVTATDIIEQLKNTDLGDELLIPSVMLRDGGDMFLDSITVTDLSEKLNVNITVTETDGYSFISALLGEEL